mgnify:CR=1 FL=1
MLRVRVDVQRSNAGPVLERQHYSNAEHLLEVMGTPDPDGKYTHRRLELAQLPTGVLIGADEVFCRQVPELLGARALVLQWLREVHRACGGKTLSA